jgi:serine/alanine adding enzyme
LAVYHRERIIAAGIASWFRDTLEMPSASSIKDYKPLCPNNMLYWQAIRFAIGRGFRRFDFGRSTPHEGTYNFKQQWGALPMQLYWQYLMDGQKTIADLDPSNPKYKVAIRFWKSLPIPVTSLPVPVTKVLGPTIVRNIP